ncbi:hypothetical protein D3C73_1174960 [compost metagenome]
MRIQRHGQATAPCGLAAKLLVLVAAHAQFGRDVLAAQAMLDESGAVPAAVFAEIGAGVHAVFVPVAADQQVLPLAQGQVVLPSDLVAIGVEHRAFVTELVALVVAVFAMAQLQA